MILRAPTVRKRVILHAGLPRTGSTAIQEALIGDHAELRTAKVLYPSAPTYTGSSAHHRLFLALLDTEHYAYLRTPYPNPLPDLETELKNLRAEINASDCQIIILSSEILWNPRAFNMAVLERLRAVLSEFEIVVTMSLRAIPAHALSGYTQRIIGPQRYTGSFAQHVAENIEDQVWSYSERLACFSEVFGHSQIRPFWYEDTCIDLLAPIRSLCGLQNRTQSEVGAKLANASPRWQITAAQLLLNQAAACAPWYRAVTRLRLALLRRGVWLGSFPPDPSQSADLAFLEQLENAERNLVNQKFETDWY